MFMNKAVVATLFVSTLVFSLFVASGANAETLTVSRSGNGTAYDDAGFLLCGDNCSASYQKGREVILSAQPFDGRSFSGWGGDCGGASTCTLKMDKDRAVTALFSDGQKSSLPVVSSSGKAEDSTAMTSSEKKSTPSTSSDEGSSWQTVPVSTSAPAVSSVPRPEQIDALSSLKEKIAAERAEIAKAKVKVDTKIVKRVAGKTLLRVSDATLWYVNPKDNKRYLLSPETALAAAKAAAQAIAASDFKSLAPAAGDALPLENGEVDSDQDGLGDEQEKALGTDPAKADTDGDGHDDRTELRGGYDPKSFSSKKIVSVARVAKKWEGKIVSYAGSAWIVRDGKRQWIGNGMAAYRALTVKPLGISTLDSAKIPLAGL